ncbi:MAG: DUF421 domain-containing protein [Clostridiales bacterium]|nr:DUF421 domain-containing protein [Clostridiales bacterium]
MIISIIRTLLLYVFVILAVRLMGKRQISDMQPSEIVVTLIISDIAAIPMQNTSQPLLSGVIPVLVLVALEIIASVLMMKSSKFRHLLCGSPIVIIEDGRIIQNQMRRLRLTTEDLCVQLRQQNIFSLEDVQYCIIETNGKISLIEKPEKRTTKAEESGIEIQDNKIETVVVSDGQILDNSLKLCGKERSDVYNILKREKSSLGDVFIMTLDALGNYSIVEQEG